MCNQRLLSREVIVSYINEVCSFPATFPRNLANEIDSDSKNKTISLIFEVHFELTKRFEL